MRLAMLSYEETTEYVDVVASCARHISGACLAPVSTVQLHNLPAWARVAHSQRLCVHDNL